MSENSDYSERRKYKRIDKRIKIKITENLADMENKLSRFTESGNISQNGFMIESREKYKVGQEYFIRLSDNNNNFIDTKCRIIWIEETLPGSLYNIGLQILFISKKTMELLKEFLQT